MADPKGLEGRRVVFEVLPSANERDAVSVDTRETAAALTHVTNADGAPRDRVHGVRELEFLLAVFDADEVLEPVRVRGHVPGNVGDAVWREHLRAAKEAPHEGEEG